MDAQRSLERSQKARCAEVPGPHLRGRAEAEVGGAAPASERCRGAVPGPASSSGRTGCVVWLRGRALIPRVRLESRRGSVGGPDDVVLANVSDVLETVGRG